MDPILGMLTLGAATWLIGLLSVAFLFCSVLLVLTVLIQRPQGGGLSGAFGAGAGSGETAFGARTGDALTIATISFFVLWLGVAVGLVLVMRPPAIGTGATEAASNENPSGPTQTPAGPEQNPPPAPDATTAPEQPAPGAEDAPATTGGSEEQPGDGTDEQPADTGAPGGG